MSAVHSVAEDGKMMRGIVAVPFDTLPPTMMVAIINLLGELDVDTVYHLLPIAHVNVIGMKRLTKTISIPYCNLPGAITSVRNKKRIRGLVRSANPNTFEHSVTIDIDTSCKPINAKISPTLIHMCGASKDETNWEAAGYIVSTIKNIQQLLDHMSSNPDRTEDTLEWVIESTRGDPIIRDGKLDNSIVCPSEKEMIDAEKERVDSEKERVDSEKERVDSEKERVDSEKERVDSEKERVDSEKETKICIPARSEICIPARSEICTPSHSGIFIPPLEGKGISIPIIQRRRRTIDREIAIFLLSRWCEYCYHSMYVSHLRFICTIKRICSPDFGINVVPEAYKVVMINYNIDIGITSVDRNILSEKFDCVDGFYTEYRNTVDHSVRITLPDLSIKRKSGSIACITFMVHQSSCVTISGKHKASIESAYKKFMNIVLGNLDEIRGGARKSYKKQRPKLLFGILKDYWFHKYTLRR